MFHEGKTHEATRDMFCEFVSLGRTEGDRTKVSRSLGLGLYRTKCAMKIVHLKSSKHIGKDSLEVPEAGIAGVRCASRIVVI